MKIKIIKSTNGKYDGQVFDLKEVSEMVCKDEAQNIEIVDGYNELRILSDYSRETNQTRFYDMHIFIPEPETLCFIDEVELINS